MAYIVARRTTKISASSCIVVESTQTSLKKNSYSHLSLLKVLVQPDEVQLEDRADFVDFQHFLKTCLEI